MYQDKPTHTEKPSQKKTPATKYWVPILSDDGFSWNITLSLCVRQRDNAPNWKIFWGWNGILST